MKTTCPSCNTIKDAIGHNLSDREIINMRQIGLSEHLCKTCYQQELFNLAAITKSDLIPLHEELEIAKQAYSKAYESWKSKANLYKAIDYNINLIKFEEEKKTKPPTKKVVSPEKKSKIEKLATEILASLSKEQQESILKVFQNNAKNGILSFQD